MLHSREVQRVIGWLHRETLRILNWFQRASTKMSELIIFDKIQQFLNFDGVQNIHFKDNGIGRIGVVGYLIGLIGGIHFGFALLSLIMLSAFSSGFFFTLFSWSSYVFLFCTFHFMEFFITAMKQPGNLSYDSFMVNQSRNYSMAAILSWVEFWLEYLIWGNAKMYTIVTLTGLILVVSGQIVRTVAMWTCGEHFSHIIQEKKDDHKLIKHGIYSVLRHPSYVGWFYWSIGTQLILCNPVCIVFYTWASWSFFANRIPYEEGLLISFHEHEYIKYMEQTFIGIPFIKTREESTVGKDQDL